MKIKSEKDFWSGLMFIAIGVAFAWGSLNYRFGSSAQPGPAYIPFALAVLMALLGAAILFRSLTLEVEGGDRIGRWAWRPLLMIPAAVALFGWTLPQLGLFVALPVLVLLAAWADDGFRWRGMLVNALVLTLGSWLVFVKGFGLALPLWPVLLSR